MKDDMSRRAVLKAADRVGRTLELIQKMLPYGPTKVQMSEGEYKDALREADTRTLQRMLEEQGTQSPAMDIIRERANAQSTPPF